MSYSRWTDSRWYTYATRTADGYPRLSVDDGENHELYTVETAKGQIVATLATDWPDATAEELAELHGYVMQWLEDVARWAAEEVVR